MLKSDAVLVHYDSTRPIKLTCDASSYGLGVVLSHVFEDGEHPVAFALCTLTKTEKNYSQIEKEALALIFGVKKFHKYLFGRSFTLLADHKPLLSILNAKADLHHQLQLLVCKAKLFSCQPTLTTLSIN